MQLGGGLFTQSVTNLLVGVVLTESVHGPDGCGNPAEKGDLQDKAYHSGERSPDGKERKPGK